MSRRLIVMLCLPAFMVCIGCSGKKETASIDPSKLAYFTETYEECRSKFITTAGGLKHAYKGVATSSINVKSEVSRGLTIDSCYIPAQQRSGKLIIISSGVHGIEGFAGSAVQRMMMSELLPKMDLSRTGVLFIHGINPYGLKNMRRVNETNIDLNRNFDVDKKLFSLKNEGYPILMGLLNPAEKLGVRSPGYLFFPARAVYYIVKFGMGTLRQSILQGQYEFEKGIYYGGRDFSPQKAAIEKLIARSAKGATQVFVMDLHTGYGERNRLHYFPNPITDKRNRAAAERVFEGYQVDWGGSGDFYITTGDFTDYIEKLFPEKTVIRMTSEYGTMDSQTTLGSIDSLKVTIMENQAFHYGGRSKSDVAKAKERFREMYYPSSELWRFEILRQTAEQFPVIFSRFSALK